MPRQRARITWRTCGQRRCGRADRQSAIPKPVKLRSRLTRKPARNFPHSIPLCGKWNRGEREKANECKTAQGGEIERKVESQSQKYARMGVAWPASPPVGRGGGGSARAPVGRAGSMRSSIAWSPLYSGSNSKGWPASLRSRSDDRPDPESDPTIVHPRSDVTSIRRNVRAMLFN